MKNKTLQALFHYKIVVLLFLIVGFLTGYFVTEYVINNNFSYYEICFSSKQHPDTFMTEDFFRKTLLDIEEYNQTAQKKITYATIDYKAMLKHSKIRSLEQPKEYKILIQRKYFPNTIKTSNGDVNSGIARCEKYMTTILTFKTNQDLEIQFINDPIAKHIGYFNPYFMGIGTTLGTFFISIAFFFIITHAKTKKILVDISDNETIFKNPFHKGYWNYATKEMSSVKNLCGISILFALMFLSKALVLPSGFGTLGIGITYLIFSAIGMIYGPCAGIIIGFFSDILGYFVFQNAFPFFLGYTFSAMLTGFIYGLCFYRTKVTFAKCLYARIFVNLVVNVGLGSLWWKILYHLNWEGFTSYLLLIELPKNLVYLLPQSIILYIFLKSVSKPMAAFGLIPQAVGENVSII